MTKYIPSDKTAADPTKEHAPVTNWATGSPGWNTKPLLVVTTLLSNNKLSPEENTSLPSPPVFKYVRNRTYQLPPVGFPIYDFIFAFTPDILPTTTWSNKLSRYELTSTPSLDIWILIESDNPRVRDVVHYLIVYGMSDEIRILVI